MTALEVLSGLAKVKLPASIDYNLVSAALFEGRKCVKWVCDYISNQCSRPPPFHSKDMHSTIVAAYHCLTVWFHEHPSFLNDKECVTTVMEVIELGISGSKSKVGNSFTTKEFKQLKPASMRVREAAESLLSSLMNSFSGEFQDNSNNNNLLDEPAVVKSYKIENNLPNPEDSVKYFRYFVNDNSLLFSILKESSDCDSVFIIRSAFGKYCWSLRNQLLPIQTKSPIKSRNNSSNGYETIARPAPGEVSTNRPRFSFKYFPDLIEKIPVNKLDLIIPSLEAVVASTKQDRTVHDEMRKQLEKQSVIEKQCQQKFPLKSTPNECKEPSPSHSFEPVRLILTHFGLLNDFKHLSQESRDNQEDKTCSMVCINNSNATELWSNLKTLDLISTRTSDTVFIFYMRKGRSDPQEILNSVSSKHYVTQSFLDFLHSVGKVIDVRSHRGWTGIVSSSWKTEEETISSSAAYSDDGFDGLNDPGSDHGGCAFDGTRKALYWNDVSHEMAFIVPSGRFAAVVADTSDDQTSSVIDSDSVTTTTSSSAVRFRQQTFNEVISTSGRSMSSDEGTSTVSTRSAYSDSSRGSLSRNNKSSKQLSLLSNIGCDTKVIVVWLESEDDVTEVPIGKFFLTFHGN